MRRTFAVAAAVAMAGISGCQQPPPKQQAIGAVSVLDVHATKRATPSYAMSPQRVTPPEEPKAAIVTAPVATVTPTPAPAAPAAAPSSAKSSKSAAQSGQASSYKVKKGDTLYHIAKAEYGDGKKWTLIASANPGVSPTSLKAGQTLVIP